MLSNFGVAEKFASGKTRGSSNHMSITGDVLYSYRARIAIRDDDKFIVSNRTSYFGGGTRSTSTSRHISCAYNACGKQKPIFLVDGWAERGKEEWFIPEIPTYKTVIGLIRGFKGWRIYGWTGEWFPKTGTKRTDWQYKDNKLLDPEGNLVAVREHLSKYEPCNKKCNLCPARFLCGTNLLPFYTGSYNSNVFFIIKGTKYEELAHKYLHPSSVIDFIPTGSIVK